jgi:hypothetical protein
MVRMTYRGLGDLEAAIRAFDELRPFHARLRAMQRNCKPFGRDYHAIAITLDALETTAYHFTRRPHFYGAGADAAGPVRREE